jgi:hypothetical protein
MDALFKRVLEAHSGPSAHGQSTALVMVSGRTSRPPATPSTSVKPSRRQPIERRLTWHERKERDSRPRMRFLPRLKPGVPTQEEYR